MNIFLWIIGIFLVAFLFDATGNALTPQEFFIIVVLFGIPLIFAFLIVKDKFTKPKNFGQDD